MNKFSTNISRRALIGTAGIAGLASSISNNLFADHHAKENKISLTKDNTILFQGDSITDAGRDKKNQVANQQKAFGGGYAWMAASHLLIGLPDLNLTIHNRGISGNKVHQLAGRWDKDCLELKPDVLSILIGVNDIWHGLNGSYDGTVKRYEDDFHALIERTRKALPNTQFVVCEPFVLKCGAVNEKWFPEFDYYRASARRVAEKYSAVFVPFQSMFDEAVKYAPANHWAGDGVHPSSHGASLMAHFWLRAVKS
jgi:lysophospholipase L1-like esterase